MNRIYAFLFSTRTMAVLLLIYAIGLAVGTFIENDYGTPASKVMIYNAKWFEFLMLWLVVLFIANIKRYQLFKKDKWPLLIFHLSFVVILIGAAITHYISFEGNMPIPEGETSNEIISSDTYFKMQVDDGKDVLKYDKSKYLISEFDEKETNSLFRRQFKGKYSFKEQEIFLKTLDYIPHAKDTVIESLKEEKMLELVTIARNGRESVYFKDGDVKNVNQTVISYNNPIPGAVQIIEENGKLFVKSPFEGEFVKMAGQQVGQITDSVALEQSRGKIHFDSIQELNLRVLYSINTAQFVIPEMTKNARMEYIKGNRNSEEDKQKPDAIVLEITTGDYKDTITIKGGQGVTGYDKNLKLGSLNISLGFGSKIIKTPFAIELRDFQLERYPGSSNASSYASEITVIDEGTRKDQRIFMNNIMDYKGYRFFQSSYFPNEQGTILSVNKDRLGTNITYVGYLLLFFGLTASLFWKGTRFWKLNKQLKSLAKKTTILLLFTLPFLGFPQHSENEKIPKINLDSLIQKYQIDSDHEKQLGKLLIQDNQGRIKPINTYSLELLRKIYKSDNFHGLSAIEWFIGMNIDPASFGRIPLIEVGSEGGEKLKNQTRSNEEGKSAFIDLLALNNLNQPYFVLDDQYKISFSKKASEQSKYDQEVIEVTERFQIASGIFEELYLKVFPVKNDLNDTWSSAFYFVPNDSLQLGYEVKINKDGIDLWNQYKKSIQNAQKSNDWSEPSLVLKEISDYQNKWGENVLPSQAKIQWEIRYNEWDIFFRSMIAYSIIAGILLLLSFLALFFESKIVKRIIQITLGALFLVFLFQMLGLILRWYISGHAPWSNGYEAIMFISWVGVLAGILLYRNTNAFIPTAGAIVAVIMMGFAHGGDLLNPQITPLVPVLKSYWLMIHVGIITSSYAFFGLSCILSVIGLILIIARSGKNKKNTNLQLKELTLVSEMSITVGLLSLTIGTFLGGIWANESWGRYWSWDPKETWAFISVIIYAFVLHMRLVPGLRGSWAFNTASMISIFSIIMTYFGVNYYLSGLHSYAAGDPIPIPFWIPLTAGIMLALASTSYFVDKKFKQKKVDL